jgi:hypothetical protein
MYPTSTLYNDAIYAPARTITGRVTFVIVDITAAGDIDSITTSDELDISDKSQLVNGVRSATFNLATWEEDRFRLDGTFSFPDDTFVNNGEVGYISDDLCDADGDFASSIDIEFVFNNPHSSVGVTITFDNFNNEYAVDFDVFAFDGDDVLIDSVNVTDNDQTIVPVLGQLADYEKIVIEVHKWSHGNRRARVIEVDFGIIEVYTDNQLITMELNEEADVITATLPAAEFNFSVDNTDKRFNILNPTGFYAFLQEQQPIVAELGLDIGGGVIEWIPVGEYLLREWISDEGSLTASFTGRTNLSLMNNFFYERLTNDVKSLKALAIQIFAQCGITNYSVPDALDSISTNSLAKRTTCRNLLQMIAIAGECNIFVTRDNIITLKQISVATADDQITFDNIYREPKVTLEPIVKQVEVSYWTDIDTAVIETVAGADTGETLKLEGNTLINTQARAQAVASWIIAQKNYRAKYRINWRDNMAHELTDVVDIENSFGADKKAFITKRTMTYAGYLRGQTEAHGEVS